MREFVISLHISYSAPRGRPSRNVLGKPLSIGVREPSLRAVSIYFVNVRIAYDVVPIRLCGAEIYVGEGYLGTVRRPFRVAVPPRIIGESLGLVGITFHATGFHDV